MSSNCLAPFLRLVTLAPVIIFIPCFSNSFWANEEILNLPEVKYDQAAQQRNLRPRFLKKLANSIPIAPEPTTSSDFGITSGTIASL